MALTNCRHFTELLCVRKWCEFFSWRELQLRFYL